MVSIFLSRFICSSARKSPGVVLIDELDKALPEYAHLEKVWENFLLGCTNCKSAKSKKPVDFGSYLMPDRDNTFIAFTYDDLGMVNPAAGLSPELRKMAEDTCELVWDWNR